MSDHFLNDSAHHSRHILLFLVRRFPVPFRIFHEVQQRQDQDQRSHTVSLYCYYYYYYYLLLFLHSFIALYKLTNASSRFSTHPLVFFFYFHPSPSALSSCSITYYYFFSCSTVPSSSFGQRRKSS